MSRRKYVVGNRKVTILSKGLVILADVQAEQQSDRNVVSVFLKMPVVEIPITRKNSTLSIRNSNGTDHTVTTYVFCSILR